MLRTLGTNFDICRKLYSRLQLFRMPNSETTKNWSSRKTMVAEFDFWQMNSHHKKTYIYIYLLCLNHTMLIQRNAHNYWKNLCTNRRNHRIERCSNNESTKVYNAQEQMININNFSYTQERLKAFFNLFIPWQMISKFKKPKQRETTERRAAIYSTFFLWFCLSQTNRT